MQSRRSSYAICNLLMFFSAALMTVIGPMLGQISEEFNLTVAQSGLLYTAEFTGFTVFILLCGVLADKLGKKTVISAILAVLAISLMLFSLSSGFVMSLVIMLFAGGFCGPLESVTLSAISDLHPENPEKYVNLNGVFYGLGAMAGPVAAGICIASDVSWRTVYLALGIASTVMLFVSLFAVLPKQSVSERLTIRAIKPILKDWRFLLVCFCIFLYCGAESSAWGWMSEYMQVNLGFTVLKCSLAIGVFWLSITVGRMICNVLGRFMRARTMVGLLAAGAAVVTFASALIKSEALIWAATVLMGLLYSSQWPLMVGQTVKRHPAQSGTSAALLVASGGISMAVIPALLGVVSENFGVFAAQILPAFFFVVILVVYCFIARPEKA